MPARTARWSGEETRVLKAERSSWEAELVCQVLSSVGEILGAYRRFQTASLEILLCITILVSSK
jgi:hypothetical protein